MQKEIWKSSPFVEDSIFHPNFDKKMDEERAARAAKNAAKLNVPDDEQPDTEPTGTFYHEQDDGKKIGSDGNIMKQRAVVSNTTDITNIKNNAKNKVSTPLDQVKSAKILPSDIALQTCIDVLNDTNKRTESDTDGGLHGESAIVFKDGTFVRGPSGKKGYVVEKGKDTGVFMTDEEFPDIPHGYSANDIEVTIHSHATNIFEWQGKNDTGKYGLYSGNAFKPSSKDELNEYWKSRTNIIVGPLGLFTLKEEKPQKQDNGIVIYKNTREYLYLKIDAVRNILKSK